MAIDKLILAGVRGSDPQTGMNTFHEFLCVRASDYDDALVRIRTLEAALRAVLETRGKPGEEEYLSTEGWIMAEQAHDRARAILGTSAPPPAYTGSITDSIDGPEPP